MPSQERPAAGHPHIDQPENHGPVVSAVLWFFLAVTILSVIGRTATKSTNTRAKTRDNLLISIALLFGVAQSIAVSFQVWNGLGRHVDTLTPTQLETYHQSAYASSLLFIPTLAFTKLSLLPLVYSLATRASQKALLFALAVAIALWSIASDLATAFQCPLPQPWRINNKCIQRNNFWTSFGVMNILTELPLIFLPLLIANRMQASGRSKALFAGPFVSRALLIPPIIASIIFANYPSTIVKDETFGTWKLVLCDQVVQNLGIITACVSYLRPFVQNIESCIAIAEDSRRSDASRAERGDEPTESTLTAGTMPGSFVVSDEMKGHGDTAKGTSSGIQGNLVPTTKELTTATVMMKSEGGA